MNSKIFIALIQEHQKILHKISSVYTNSAEDKEDLFQEMVFQLWKSRTSFKAKSKISTWIYRIAINTALSSFRKKRIQFEPFESEKIQLSHLQEKFTDQQILLFEAIKKLNDSDRALLLLFLDGYGHREIGEIIGITENNVNVKMTRIRKKIKKIIQK